MDVLTPQITPATVVGMEIKTNGCVHLSTLDKSDLNSGNFDYQSQRTEDGGISRMAVARVLALMMVSNIQV